MKIRAGGGDLGQEGGTLGQQGAPPCYSSLWETLLKTRNPKTGTLANSEDQDEMQYYATFHQSLHCLLRQNRYSENFF